MNSFTQTTEYADTQNTTGAGVLARSVRRIAGVSTRWPKTVIVLWLALVIGCVTAGGVVGTKELKGSDAGVGQSARADRMLEQAHLSNPAVENVLVRGEDAEANRRAAAELQKELGGLKHVRSVRGPPRSGSLSIEGGRTLLVQASIEGSADNASDKVGAVQRAVKSVGKDNPGVQFVQSGDASFEKAIDKTVADDLQQAEIYSLPITLIILIAAFGALVAAFVPLLLGITSVAAAMGLMGVISQFAPMGDAASSLVVLIGLAVGVDYSLFYVRREREERRLGRGPRDALDVAASTVGRAIVVSGLTVMVALAGLMITGMGVFTSMALATISVVLIAVIGSVTVLPATLAVLGEKVNRGRIPFIGKRRELRAARMARVEGPKGLWGKLAAAVTRRPVTSLVTTVCLLGALAVPALDMHTGEQGSADLPPHYAAVEKAKTIEHAFPGAPDTAQIVLSGRDLGSIESRQGLEELGASASEATGIDGNVDVKVSGDGRTAAVTVPMPDRDPDGMEKIVSQLRDDVAPKAAGMVPGSEKALVTGEAASDVDSTNRLQEATPIVIALVLGLAFLLLLSAFRSVRLAAGVMALNLLSVVASYGALVAVFQHTWAEDLLGFTSSGTITNWLPLFMFVILFGLSMDYTVIVLERIREARMRGLGVRAAAAEGVGATAGAVTSAALVMVGVFSIFGTLHLLEMKQLGVGLAVAVLIDATIVRGVALPATVALLGERGMPAARRPRRRRHASVWDDRAMVPSAGARR